MEVQGLGAGLLSSPLMGPLYFARGSSNSPHTARAARVSRWCWCSFRGPLAAPWPPWRGLEQAAGWLPCPQARDGGNLKYDIWRSSSDQL